MINDSITQAIQTTIPTYVNGAITKSDGALPIWVVPNWFLDFTTETQYMVNDQYFGMDMKGLFFDKRVGETEPSVAIPDMPIKNTEHAEKFQAFLSTYVIDSLFDSYLKVGKIEGELKSVMLPSTSPIQLNTNDTTMNLVFPGIKSYYGADVPLDIHLKFHRIGEFDITYANQNMAGLADFDLELWANKTDGTREMAVSLTLSEVAFGFSLLINDMKVSSQITEVYSGKVAVNSCTFANLSALKLKIELNNGWRIA